MGVKKALLLFQKSHFKGGRKMFEFGMLVVMMLALLIVARLVFGVVSRLEGFSLTYETVINDNPAIGIRYGTFLLAVVISFLSVLHPSGLGWMEDANIVAGYGLLAIVLLVISRWINDFFILYDFRNNREVIGEKNVSVAIVEAGTFLATAFIMSGALGGWEGGFWIALMWFGIGQAFLIILNLLYRLTTWGVGPALDTHNTACGVSLGGFLLSGGIVLGAAVSGPVTSLLGDVTAVAVYVAWWLVMVVLVHFVLNFLLLPGSRLRKEIMEDRNVGAAVIETAVALATTLFYIKVW